MKVAKSRLSSLRAAHPDGTGGVGGERRTLPFCHREAREAGCGDLAYPFSKQIRDRHEACFRLSSRGDSGGTFLRMPSKPRAKRGGWQSHSTRPDCRVALWARNDFGADGQHALAQQGNDIRASQVCVIPAKAGIQVSVRNYSKPGFRHPRESGDPGLMLLDYGSLPGSSASSGRNNGHESFYTTNISTPPGCQARNDVSL